MDALVLAFDRAIRTLSGSAQARRTNPSAHLDVPQLSDAERKESIALMRVNHAGEVAAQALYQGQRLTAKTREIQEKLAHAADEELDHLAWTRRRLTELGGRPSLLDPLWYTGAFVIGAVAGSIGDKASLGFLQATEEQVEAHLGAHLNRLPAKDVASRAIVEQMKQDEAQHAQTARNLGAETLPRSLQALMRVSAKVMTTAAAKI
ncbi:MAG: 2-polyprenyl-3-methyl-6-methoxy-1,4-benzoquinone monooxygenase [Casimicrobium sp.]